MFVKLELSKAQIPVGALSKEWVYGRSLAGIAVSSPPRTWLSVTCECCVLSIRGLCDRPIPCPEESYRVLVCVRVCVCVCARASVCVCVCVYARARSGARITL